MRRLHALLIAAGLAVAPSGSALAGPDPKPEPVETFESFTVTSKGRLGVLVIQLTPELREHFGAANDRGVLVGRVDASSAAAAAGLAVGDVITDVRGTAVDEASDVIRALAPLRSGETVSIQVIRDGKPLALTATMRDNPPPAGIFDRKLEHHWPRWFRELFTPWHLPSDGSKPLPDKRMST